MEQLDLNKYKRTETGRIDLSKTFSNVPLPNLCDVQLDSFKWFETVGIEEVFKDIFPVMSNKDTRGRRTDSGEENAVLDFVSAEWRERPTLLNRHVCREAQQYGQEAEGAEGHYHSLLSRARQKKKAKK